MTREELKAWLETIKPGDEVAYDKGRGCYRNWWVILTVERTTKTQIIMRGGYKFRKSDGREVGSDSWNNIQPITDKIRAEMRRSKAIGRYNEITAGANRYTTEQLEAVIAILTATQLSDTPPELG